MKRDHPDAHEPTQHWPEGWTATGLIELLEPLVLPERAQRIREVAAQRIASVTLLMDAPHDPHNGAAVVRSCDAFGISSLHVVQRHEPFVVARRTSCGADRWIEIHQYAAPEPALDTLSEGQFSLVTTHPEGQLEPEDLATIPRLALVLGNEHDGIRQSLVEAAQRSVRIPMRGFVESLNLSVSAAVLMHAATRGRKGDLTTEQHDRFVANGLRATVQRVDEILAGNPPR